MIKNETRNGILRSYPAEHGDISIKETLISPKLRGHVEENSTSSNAEVFCSHGEFLTDVTKYMRFRGCSP